MFVTFSWLGTHSYVWPAADWLSKVTVLLRTFQKVSKSLTVSRWLWRIITDLSCCLTLEGEKFLHAKTILIAYAWLKMPIYTKFRFEKSDIFISCGEARPNRSPHKICNTRCRAPGWPVKDWDEGTKIRIPAQIRNTKQKHRTLFSLRL